MLSLCLPDGWFTEAQDKRQPLIFPRWRPLGPSAGVSPTCLCPACQTLGPCQGLDPHPWVFGHSQMQQAVGLVDTGGPRDHHGNERLEPMPLTFTAWLGSWWLALPLTPGPPRHNSHPGSPSSAVPVAAPLRPAESCFQGDKAPAGHVHS